MGQGAMNHATQPRRVVGPEGCVWVGEGEDVAQHVARALTTASGQDHMVEHPTDWVEITTMCSTYQRWLPSRWST